ncbi:predicted protein [Plenodomus lingam JN3]|uniref:Predicted protein n=1 Tax=Leptosphaeria maculans (strain JN3 / isolate v23.1.3 / race Av1-4-5-6-7-8) TaxID=985895 RepID=E4ZP14_LEPMJ|nr:predicted protein [Plenodomus lingam JN3]CBX93383.1 predicted protein [Plenodomus lingam JN3]
MYEIREFEQGRHMKRCLSAWPQSVTLQRRLAEQHSLPLFSTHKKNPTLASNSAHDGGGDPGRRRTGSERAKRRQQQPCGKPHQRSRYGHPHKGTREDPRKD